MKKTLLLTSLCLALPLTAAAGTADCPLPKTIRHAFYQLVKYDVTSRSWRFDSFPQGVSAFFQWAENPKEAQRVLRAVLQHLPDAKEVKNGYCIYRGELKDNHSWAKSYPTVVYYVGRG